MPIQVVQFQPIKGPVKSGSTITLSYQIEDFTGSLTMKYTGDGVTLDGAETQMRTHEVTSPAQVISDSFTVVGAEGTHAIIVQARQGSNIYKDEFDMT